MTIRGPEDSGAMAEFVLVYSDEHGCEVNFTGYPDGRLWEATWPYGTRGGIVAELIDRVPATALDMGDGWISDDDASRTFAPFWEPSL